MSSASDNPDWKAGYQAGLAEAKEQVKTILKTAYKFDDPDGFLEDMVEWSGFTGGAR